MDIFGPQLQGYQTENPLKSMADVQTLYGNQQIQQKNALMLQQQQQEMQQTNALMQAVRQPGVINQETGEITPHGRNALMGVAPMVAPKLIQTMDLARQERTKSQVNELQAGMDRLKINESGSKALADAYTGMDEAYKAAVPTMGEVGARNYVNEQIRPDFEKKLKTGGLLPPEVTDKIGGTFDPEKNRIALAAATSHAEMLKRQQASEGGTLMVGDNVLPSGEVKQTLVKIPKSGPPLQYYAPEKKWVQADDLPPNLRGVNQLTAEQAGAKAKAVAEGKAEGEGTSGVSESSEALLMNAYRLLTDGTYPTNMGRGQQGAAERKKIDNEAARLAKEMGMDPSEIRMAQLTNKAQVAAIAQLGRARAQILQFEKTATYNADLALDASGKATRSGVPLLNRGIQWAQENLAGDPTLRRFTDANETFITEYAKVMSGGYGAAATTEGAQQRAHTLINRAVTKEEYSAAVDQLKKEMNNRVRALNDQMKEERDRLFSGVAKPTGSTGETKSTGKYEPGKEYKDAKGNRARYNTDGTWTELGK